MNDNNNENVSSTNKMTNNGANSEQVSSTA